jgi:hypothetical protein
MQVRTAERVSAGPAPPRHPIRRFRDSIADAFSPTLHCGDCGAASKQRRCERTGASRPVPQDASWSRWGASETEYRCPLCGASIWVLNAPMVYPLF